MERYFRLYVQSWVTRHTSPVCVHYIPPVQNGLQRMSFRPNCTSKYQEASVKEFTITVTSPIFFAHFFLYATAMDAFQMESYELKPDFRRVIVEGNPDDF